MNPTNRLIQFANTQGITAIAHIELIDKALCYGNHIVSGKNVLSYSSKRKILSDSLKEIKRIQKNSRYRSPLALTVFSRYDLSEKTDINFILPMTSENILCELSGETTIPLCSFDLLVEITEHYFIEKEIKSDALLKLNDFIQNNKYTELRNMLQNLVLFLSELIQSEKTSLTEQNISKENFSKMLSKDSTYLKEVISIALEIHDVLKLEYPIVRRKNGYKTKDGLDGRYYFSLEFVKHFFPELFPLSQVAFKKIYHLK